MSQEAPHFKIRLPVELKARLENSAKEQGRSLTADIVWRLEKSFDLPSTLPEDLQRRIAHAAEQSGRSFDAEMSFWLESHAARLSGITEREVGLMRALEDIAQHIKKGPPKGAG